ncbi:MAG: alpha-N-acetylglucosaminidase C-terminal domain-containing protein [Planctomycetaceae bacterium]|nr:alpha-N-acetylglucosaminidase C-terminal domain-containing protein [Planctomycetaceae bacterium]
MKRFSFLLLITAAFFVNLCPAESAQPQSIVALAERVQLGLSKHFLFELTTDSVEKFEIETVDQKTVIRGGTLNSITAGLGWYLKYYCNSGTFWTVTRNKISIPLPEVKQKITRQTSMPHRYYMNHCVDRYTYRFWDWARWEQEIDWMALNGVNIAMLFLDRQAVMHKVVESYGVRETVNPYYRDKIIPQTQFIYQLNEIERLHLDRRIHLQQDIIARMRELGIQPALDGYKGIVPRQLTDVMKNFRYLEGGKWLTHTKEPAIDVTDPFFEEFGRKYYQKQKELYGEQFFIIADPIIEGTGPQLDYGELGLKMQKLILEAYPNAIWVLQGWHGNPRDALLTKTDPERILILDLYCDADPQWRKREIFSQNPWIWCILYNFGGNSGMFGKLDEIFEQLAEAKSQPQGQFLRGVGALPEAIENNPVVWNALFESAWTDGIPDMNLWARDYAKSRYGKRNEHAEKAWSLLHQTIYNAPRLHSSIMHGRPKLVKNGRTIETLFPAWDEMLLAAKELGDNDGYQSDLVDLTRQILSHYMWKLYPHVIAAHLHGDQELFDSLSKRFLELFDDMDKVLSTRKEFMVGNWIEMHRKWGQNEAQKNYYEKFAKVLLTTYDETPLSENTGLVDYACREWSGIMIDLYKARFEKYFSELRKSTDKNIEPQIDWWNMEHAWAVTRHNYPSVPSGSPVAACQAIHDKYRNSFKVAETPFSNVAFKKPAKASSAYNEILTAENAVDGDLSHGGRWVTKNNVFTEHWVEIDLQGSYTISSFRLARHSLPLPNPQQMPMWRFQIWVDGKWVTVVSEDNCPANKYPLYYGKFDPVTTNKVRWYVPEYENNMVRLFELQVFRALSN